MRCLSHIPNAQRRIRQRIRILGAPVQKEENKTHTAVSGPWAHVASSLFKAWSYFQRMILCGSWCCCSPCSWFHPLKSFYFSIKLACLQTSRFLSLSCPYLLEGTKASFHFVLSLSFSVKAGTIPLKFC